MRKLHAVRVALVANSRSGSEDRVGEIRGLLADAGAQVEVIAVESLCDGPGAIDAGRVEHVAARLRGDAGAAAVERVVVAGGDGSVGAAAVLAAKAGVTLGVVPAGTANDLARFLDLPLDVEEAAQIAADLSAGTRTVELAVAGGRRPFLNAASTGLSVLAARNAGPLKPRLGRLAYAVGALRAGVSGHPLDVVVRRDGEVAFAGRAWQVVVGATGAFGGGSGTGGVDQHDQQLDVAIVEAGSRATLVRKAWAMRNRRLVDDPGVLHVRGAVIEVEGATRFNVDGELIAVEPARFEVVGRVRVAVP
jgi:diacylglycerol kinase family enzyme